MGWFAGEIPVHRQKQTTCSAVFGTENLGSLSLCCQTQNTTVIGLAFILQITALWLGFHLV